MGNIRITRQSNFLDGIAYPSLHYGYDFGGTSEGLHNPARIAEVNRDFAEFSRNGVHLVRMNVFTDGRPGSGIVFDQQGNPTGIEPTTITGLRNVIAAARANNIQLSFVMLDHTFAEGAIDVDSNQPQLGTKQGHGALLRNAQSRQQLLNNVLQPILDEIGRNPANVLSVELVNEPESLIGGWSTNQNMPNLIAQRDLPAFKQFMRDFRDQVHASGAQFTVGSLALRFAGNWLDVLDPARDYLSIHYYAQNGEPPYNDLYQPLGQLKSLQAAIPVVWGEYAANGANEFPNPNVPQQFGSTRQFLEDSLNGGMKGGFAWSFYDGIGRRGDMFGFPPLAEHRNFTADHSLRIEFAGGRPPALPRRSLLDQFRDLLSPGTLGTSGASRPATPASRPSPPINRWNPFDSRNLSNPNNPINIQRSLQASAERSRRISESANRQAELARASARRAQEMATRRTFTQGLSSPIRTGASSRSFTRPPFQPLGGPRTTFGGPPVNPHGLPHRQAHHIPTWRDYHRPKTTGNPFGSQVTNWGTLPIRTHHLPRHHRPAYRPPPIGVMRPGSLVS